MRADDGPAPPRARRLIVATGRLEAFSDGVFAVAITLLIFGIATPRVGQGHLARARLAQWPSYATYVVSFLTIGIIWVNHHGTFARIAVVDRPLLFVNLLLLMAVSFIPFPTSLLGAYIVQGGANAKAAAVVYAGTMTVLSLSFSGIWISAVRRGLLHPERIDQSRARATVPRFGVGMVIYGLSIGLALISPPLDLALFALLALFYAFDQQAT